MSSPERILIVWYSPFGLGGVETFTLHFAREAISHGAQVWIAATRVAEGPLKAEFEAIGARLVDWTSFSEAFMDRTGQQAARSRIREDFARIRPTLTILNDCNDFSIGAAPLLRRVRPNSTIVDIFHLDSPDTKYLQMRDSFVDVLDGSVGTNQNVLSAFAARGRRFAAVPARYIPQGVPECALPHASPGETLKLLYLGRIVQDQKRVLLLPDLFAELRRRGRSFAATICGTGPQAAELETMLRERDLLGQVTLAGYCPPERAQQMLLSHDALVNVSAFEGGFSMCVLEALAAGCVPTCTDHPSTDHSQLVDGTNCVLAPVDRPEILVDAWERLAPQRISQLSLRARETARTLTSAICFERNLAFVAKLRTLRPLEPWSATPAFDIDWDMSRHNPWLPGRAGWRGVVHAMRRKVAGT